MSAPHLIAAATVWTGKACRHWARGVKATDLPLPAQFSSSCNMSPCCHSWTGRGSVSCISTTSLWYLSCRFLLLKPEDQTIQGGFWACSSLSLMQHSSYSTAACTPAYRWSFSGRASESRSDCSPVADAAFWSSQDYFQTRLHSVLTGLASFYFSDSWGYSWLVKKLSHRVAYSWARQRCHHSVSLTIFHLHSRSQCGQKCRSLQDQAHTCQHITLAVVAVISNFARFQKFPAVQPIPHLIHPICQQSPPRHWIASYPSTHPCLLAAKMFVLPPHNFRHWRQLHLDELPH